MAKLLLVLFLFPLSSFAQECPVKAGEDKLTLMRIMYNFRDYLNDPDLFANTGNQKPDAVSNAQLEKALSDIKVVVACMNVVFEKSPEQYPERFHELTGQEQTDYLTSYFEYMETFKAAVLEYQSMYEAVFNSEVSSRNFRDLYMKALEVREIANQAHHKL